MSKIKAGILGLGTVGTGVVKTMRNNRDKIKQATGYDIEISRVLVKNPEKKREVHLCPEILCDTAEEWWRDDFDVVIEVMGGIQPAKSFVEKALLNGTHVITANKELMAKYGPELLKLAAAQGVHLRYEASVAGGIPILHTLQTALQANRVTSISGILNGTTNYILSQMETTRRPFHEILAEAQAKGYAEADPASDVEGFDAVYKLTLLARLCFQREVSVNEVSRKGITEVTVDHLEMAAALGCKIKLLAEARVQDDSLNLRVEPVLLPASHPLANVNDVFNAVHVEAYPVGELTFVGRGAGQLPTASAVVEDLMFILRYAHACGGRNRTNDIYCREFEPVSAVQPDNQLDMSHRPVFGRLYVTNIPVKRKEEWQTYIKYGKELDNIIKTQMIEKDEHIISAIVVREQDERDDYKNEMVRIGEGVCTYRILISPEGRLGIKPHFLDAVSM